MNHQCAPKRKIASYTRCRARKKLLRTELNQRALILKEDWRIFVVSVFVKMEENPANVLPGEKVTAKKVESACKKLKEERNKIDDVRPTDDGLSD